MAKSMKQTKAKKKKAKKVSKDNGYHLVIHHLETDKGRNRWTQA